MSYRHPRQRPKLLDALGIWAAHAWLAAVAYFVFSNTYVLATIGVLLCLSALALSARPRRRESETAAGKSQRSNAAHTGNRVEPTLPTPEGGWPWQERMPARKQTALANRELNREAA